MDYRNPSTDTFVCIESTDQLIEEILKTPGDDSKPLRLITTSTGKKMIVKFGLFDSSEDPNGSRIECLKDEINNIRLLRTKKLKDYIVEPIWWSVTPKAALLCLEYVEPWKDASTFREFCNQCDDLTVFKQCLFMVIFTLKTIQDTFPGFRHNDFKADNVLVHASLREIRRHFELNGRSTRKWSFVPAVCTTLIDFELSNSDGNVVSRHCEHNEEFGLQKEFCEVFDIHLFLLDVLFNIHSAHKKEYYEFITSCIPSSLFNKTQLTVQSRMSLCQQKDWKTCGILEKLLSSMYFLSFRDE